MNYFKRIETLVIAVVILVLGVSYGLLSGKPRESAVITPLPPPIQDVNQSQQEVPATTVIHYPGQDGKTALELLKAGYRVETKGFDMGEYVESIDGVAPDSTHFWAFYVNDAQATVGAGSYVTKSSDQIEWRLEKIL